MPGFLYAVLLTATATLVPELPCPVPMFAAPVYPGTVDDSVADFAIGDFDGDGDADAVMTFWTETGARKR